MGAIETGVWAIWFAIAGFMTHEGIEQSAEYREQPKSIVQVVEVKKEKPPIDIIIDIEDEKAKYEPLTIVTKGTNKLISVDMKEDYPSLWRIGYYNIAYNDVNYFSVEKDGKEYTVAVYIDEENVSFYVNDGVYELYKVRDKDMVEIDLRYDYRELGNNNEKRLLYISIDSFEFELKNTLETSIEELDLNLNSL